MFGKHPGLRQHAHGFPTEYEQVTHQSRYNPRCWHEAESEDEHDDEYEDEDAEEIVKEGLHQGGHPCCCSLVHP